MTHDIEPKANAVRVLVLEEDMVRLRLLEMTLRSRGHRPTLCTDAEAAWREYRRAEHSLVLLGGPHPSALLFCRRIRRLPESNSSVVIIIAWRDRPKEARSARLAGADDILLMPLDPELASVRLASVEQRVGISTQREKSEDGLRKTGTMLDKRLAERSARLASRENVLQDERAARRNAEAALDRMHADVERRISEHMAHADAMTEARAIETARRAETEAALREAEKRAVRHAVDHADQVRAVRAALTAENERRKRVEADLRHTEGEVKRRAADHANALSAVTEALRLETSYRAGEEAASRLARDEAEKRLADQAADIERMRGALEAESKRRRSLEAALRDAREETDLRARQGMTSHSHIQSSRHLRPLPSHECLDAAKASPTDSLDSRNQIWGKSGHEFWEVILSRILTVIERDANVSLLTAQLEREIEARHHCELRIEGTRTPSLAGNAEEIALLNRRLQEETARREHAEAVLRAAETTNRTNAETMANGRHDLRIMMDGVIGATELALDADLTPPQRDHLRAAHSATTAAVQALNNRLGPGNVTPLRREADPVTFRLRSLLAEPFAALENRARRKGVTLRCVLAPGVPDSVAGNPRQLLHALGRLVGHAIRVTASGEVTVCVDCAGRRPFCTALLITIADGRTGLTAEHQLAMFDTVARSREIISQPTAATELELPIAAELVRGMGGRMWFESDLDQGTKSRFTIRLELPSDNEVRVAGPEILFDRPGSMPSDSSPADSGGGTRGRLVLLADDTPDDRAAAARLLERQGYHVITASDGRQAIAAVEDHPFDIALIDLRMPRMDGFELAAVIRTLEDPRGPRLPIVALASFAGKADQERCRAVGIDYRLAKPLEPTVIFSTIEKLVSRAA